MQTCQVSRIARECHTFQHRLMLSRTRTEFSHMAAHLSFYKAKSTLDEVEKRLNTCYSIHFHEERSGLLSRCFEVLRLCCTARVCVKSECELLQGLSTILLVPRHNFCSGSESTVVRHAKLRLGLGISENSVY